MYRTSEKNGICKPSRPRKRHATRNSAFAHKISEMRFTISPIQHVRTGEMPPNFPHTVLELCVLTEDQLDALAEFYSQVTRSDETDQYQHTMEWNQSFLDKDPTLPEDCKLTEVERLAIKQRMFAIFIGAKEDYTPVWEYERELEILWNKIQLSVRGEEIAEKKDFEGLI